MVSLIDKANDISTGPIKEVRLPMSPYPRLIQTYNYSYFIAGNRENSFGTRAAKTQENTPEGCFRAWSLDSQEFSRMLSFVFLGGHFSPLICSSWSLFQLSLHGCQTKS